MNPELRAELLKMEQYDQRVRAELAADGSLFEGYHPRMEEIHRFHAKRLREMIERFGWPTEKLVGPEGAKAAWLIAQHSIGEPEFMRRCRELIDLASSQGEIPRWQFAFIDDRIKVFEGSPQSFGTQFRGGDWSVAAYPLEDPDHIEERRREAGLPPMAEILGRMRANPPPPALTKQASEVCELAWRRKAGWIS